MYFALFGIGSLIAVWRVSGDPVCYTHKYFDKNNNSRFSRTECNTDPENIYVRFESREDFTIDALIAPIEDQRGSSKPSQDTSVKHGSTNPSAIKTTGAKTSRYSSFGTTAVSDIISTENIPGSGAIPSTVGVSQDAWTEYQFRFQDNWNGCSGKRYVRKRPVDENATGQYVGVILCTDVRYKIFMADVLDSEFLNIGDASGHGEDHCEFVGAPEDGTFNLYGYSTAPSTTGYYRLQWGRDVQFGTIGINEGAYIYYPKWYECGVSIP